MDTINQGADQLKQQAKSLLQAQQFLQAKQVLTQVSNLAKNDFEVWFLLGVANGLLGLPNDAEKCSRKALDLNPKFTHAMFNLGKSLNDQSKYDEAITVFQGVLNIEPMNVNAMNCLTHALLQVNEVEKAKNICEHAIKLAPGNPETHLTMGNIFKKIGNPQSAVSCYDNAIRVNPSFVAAIVNKGLTLQEGGKFDEAMICYERALTIIPQLSEVHYSIGLIYLAKSDRDKAIDHFKIAFESAPTDTKTGLQYAGILRYQGHIEEAIRAYHHILNVDPENLAAQFYIKTLEEGVSPSQIPPEMLKAVYNSEDAAKGFDSSLIGRFDYKAPEIMNTSIREALTDKCKDLDVLDLGCGTGLCASKLRDVARHLEGVDISSNMIAEAEKKNVYDKLAVADIMDVLDQHEDDMDVIIAMDVLCFFGDLSEVYKKSSITLRQNGIFGFTVEKDDSGEDWTFHNYGNFLHAEKYLRRMGEEYGFKAVKLEEMVLRKELYEPRVGYLCLFQKL